MKTDYITQAAHVFINNERSPVLERWATQSLMGMAKARARDDTVVALISKGIGKKRLAAKFGISNSSMTRQLQRLAKEGRLEAVECPSGMRYVVREAK